MVMDLVRQLKEVPPLRPEAYERARATLGTKNGGPVRRERFAWLRNLSLPSKVGIGVVGPGARGRWSAGGPDGSPEVMYNLYTDKGEVYVTEDKRGLSAIAHHDNLADPMDARVIAGRSARGDR
jgi:hypothetical protein